MDEATLARCQEIISYRFSNGELFDQALTHASAASRRSASNERLEFLGDAVLGVVICEAVFTRYPDLTEGEMTKIKSSVVSRRTCAKIANESGIAGLLRLGKGVGSSKKFPMSMAAAVFEAVIGAIFLEGGFPAAREFVLEQMGEAIEQAAASEHKSNYKSVLQQYVQQKTDATPQYDLVDEKGPEHAKCFEIAVRLDGRRYPSAWGRTKKEAEQKAALAALTELGVLEQADIESSEEPG